MAELASGPLLPAPESMLMTTGHVATEGSWVCTGSETAFGRKQACCGHRYLEDGPCGLIEKATLSGEAGYT